VLKSLGAVRHQAVLFNMSTGSARPTARPNGYVMKNNSVRVMDNHYEAMDVLKPVAEEIGKENIFGCVRMQGQWVITLKNKADVELIQATGLMIRNNLCPVTGVTRTLLTVSVFGVPTYMEDDEISDKLEEYGCILKTKWVHNHYKEYPGIENGIRYVRLEMPNQAKSLPYSITVNGVFLKLKHDGQMKVCNLCLSQNHLIRECPMYVCRSCNKQGHWASKCSELTCYRCNEKGHKAVDCVGKGNAEPEHVAEIQPKTNVRMEVEGNRQKEPVARTNREKETVVPSTSVDTLKPKVGPKPKPKPMDEQRSDECMKEQSKQVPHITTGWNFSSEPPIFGATKSTTFFQHQPSTSTSTSTNDDNSLKRTVSSDEEITQTKLIRTGQVKKTPNLSVARRFTPKPNKDKT